MIAIQVNSTNFLRAFKTYKDEIPGLVKVRLAKELGTAPPTVSRLLSMINTHMDEILVSKPARLMTLSKRFLPFLTNANAAGELVESDFAKALKRIFNYKWFTEKTVNRYSAYHLTAALGVNVCVYCNRTYTHTIVKRDNKKIARPTLDHYFNKGRHPLLALSFYNLIPSCNVCNSGVKHDMQFELLTHYHPFLDDYIGGFTFSYKPDLKQPSGLRILIKSTDNKAIQTLQDLQTEELYNTHTIELKEMLDMRYKFSNNYLTILEKHVLSGTRVSQKELYRIAFSVEMEQANFGQRPFSKFKSDILKELDIIS